MKTFLCLLRTTPSGVTILHIKTPFASVAPAPVVKMVNKLHLYSTFFFLAPIKKKPLTNPHKRTHSHTEGEGRLLRGPSLQRPPSLSNIFEWVKGQVHWIFFFPLAVSAQGCVEELKHQGNANTFCVPQNSNEKRNLNNLRWQKKNTQDQSQLVSLSFAESQGQIKICTYPKFAIAELRRREV